MTFLSVVILDVDYGLGIGVGISIFMIIFNDQQFEIKNLARYDNTSEFVDDDLVTNIVYPVSTSTIKIFKVQRSIYFANCESFQTQLYKHYGFSPNHKPTRDMQRERNERIVTVNPVYESSTMDMTDISSASDISQFDEPNNQIDPDVILDFSAVNYVDTNGIKMLYQTIEDFKKINVNVYICGAQGKFDIIIRYYYWRSTFNLVWID